MRGKVEWTGETATVNGITPAYAGKSTWFRLALGDNEDHPRLCGEKDQEVIRTCAPYRITPAYAGKSMSFQKLPCLYQDHPRLCGEKAFALFVHQLTSGSPPPMRGKAFYFTSRFIIGRITPAYAGKSLLRSTKRLYNQDHPRLCGEKELCYDSTRPCLGSPPPMRGKDQAVKKSMERTRITPAYAGKRCHNCMC